METSMLTQSRLLATKFYVPVAPGPVISRPRLAALLDESLKRRFTLVSAPAGFGKTTLLSTWGQSLPVSQFLLAWVSLGEEDNEPRLFWTSVIEALDLQHPGFFRQLLMELESQQTLPLKYVLTAFINLLAGSSKHFVLILDDYQVIVEQQVHTLLSYLLDHLPRQLHILLATRTEPPLQLSHLQARGQMREVRADQLRCTVEETGIFFKEVMNVELSEEMIQQVASRTEGWLVGLQLLALILPEQADPLTLLEEVRGDQRYILDYLTEVVLQQQPQEVQMFLLSTSILEKLSPSICDAVMQQHGSYQMLEHLERANLFVVSLDSKREWYRYHALFAESLRYQLKQTHADLVPTLHCRASIWYAEHYQTTQAILHAFEANDWQRAADLIEGVPLMSFDWGTGRYELVLFRQWLERLPTDIVHARPRLCLACAQLLWAMASQAKLLAWLDAAETTLTTSLRTQTPVDASNAILASQPPQELENLLGEVIAFRAFLQSAQGDGQVTLSLCQQAETLLSAENLVIRSQVASARLLASYASSANDATIAVESGLQACALDQAAGNIVRALSVMGTTIMHMIGTGQLRQAQQLVQQAMLLGMQPERLVLPEVGWPMLFRAEILREWNKLDDALSLAQEAISLCEQTASIASPVYSLCGNAVLLRIFLSRGDYDKARSCFQQLERVGMNMNQLSYTHLYSFFTIVDQVRLWLACRERNRAMYWVKELNLGERHGSLFAREREEVACARILLASDQPAWALERLVSVLERASAGKRWGHVIEIRLLQALAYQMLHEQMQALDALWQAIHLAEPEGYIRSFIDEGAPMEALLYRLRKRESKQGPTLYLDTLLTAFQQERMAWAQVAEQTQAQALPEPLSERELQVLHLLARGVSNQEIGQELVIAIDTVKRHVKRILAKLGVQNRFHAVKQARELGLLDEE